MSKKLIPAIVVAVVAIIIVLLVSKKAPVSTDTPVGTGVEENATTTVAKPVKTVKKPSVVTPAPVTPVTPDEGTDEPVEEETPATNPVTVTERFYVSDTTGTPKSLEANEGDTVQVTFVANPTDNRHGGLEFRSPGMDAVRVMNGQSKMITFTATESFSFTPYWPGSDDAKPYTIDIIVK